MEQEIEAENDWNTSRAKWDETAWDRLEEYVKTGLSTSSNLRHDAWKRVLWNECSYCRKYQGCDHCPLYLLNGCYTVSSLGDYLTSDMRYAWIHDNKEAFEVARKKFVEMLEQTKW